MIPSCKKAGELLSNAEERELSLLRRIGLTLHLMFCSMCRQFQKNLSVLRHSMGNILDEGDELDTAAFRSRVKDAVKRKIDGK